MKGQINDEYLQIMFPFKNVLICLMTLIG